MPKKSSFKTPFDSQYVKVIQTLVNSAWKHFYHIFSSPWGKLMIWKMSLLVICEILGRFINTLTADDKYFLRNSENFQQLIQMGIPKKQKTFS